MTSLTRQVAWARATGDAESRPWRSHPEGRSGYLKWGHQALGKRESRTKRKGQNGAQKLRETLVVVGRAKEGGTCELREILSPAELLLNGLGQGCLLSLPDPPPLPVLVTASTSPSGPTPLSYLAHNRGYRCVGPMLWFHRWANVPGLANQSIPFPGHVDNTWMGLRVNLVEKRKLAKKLRTRAEAPQIAGMPTEYLQSCVARMKLEDMLREINKKTSTSCGSTQHEVPPGQIDIRALRHSLPLSPSPAQLLIKCFFTPWGSLLPFNIWKPYKRTVVRSRHEHSWVSGRQTIKLSTHLCHLPPMGQLLPGLAVFLGRLEKFLQP